MDGMLPRAARDFENRAGLGQNTTQDVENGSAIAFGSGCDSTERVIVVGVIGVHGAFPVEVLASVSAR
jgi:hypothetical protein